MKQIVVGIFMLLFCNYLTCCKSPDTVYQDINKAEWEQNDTLEYLIPKQQYDQKQMTIYIRHTNDYAFQNIWLKISCEPKDSTLKFDRYEFQLAQPNGVWLGHKSGAIYNFSTPIEGLDCKGDTCKILVLQDMRANPLVGVQSVGFGFE